MAWDDDMPTILRVLVNDTSTSPKYDDDSLINLLLTSGMLLQLEGGFAADYAISIGNQTLTPDPTKMTPPDRAFISLATLRAAVQLITFEIRAFVEQGIEIRDGTSVLKLQREYHSMQTMLEAYGKQYGDALYAWKTGGGEALGQVIVTPYPLLEGGDRGMGSLYGGYPAGDWCGFGIGMGAPS